MILDYQGMHRHPRRGEDLHRFRGPRRSGPNTSAFSPTTIATSPGLHQREPTSAMILSQQGPPRHPGRGEVLR